MISMYAEYSGRTLYVALSSDTIEGAKNGDKLYEMDTGKRYVYNENNDSWDEQPEEGGGGGGGVEIRNVTFRNSIGTNIGVMALAPVAELNNEIYYVAAITGFQANTERTGTFAVQNKRLIISNSSTAWNGLKFRIGSTDLTADYVQLQAPSYKTYSILLPDDYEETDVIEIYK